MTLADKVIFITGASRGIGREIALRCAKDGAKIVIAAKTGDPHPSLPGTIYSVAEEVERMGGSALPIVVDVRHEENVQNAIEEAVQHFGQIDILVNNASALHLASTLAIPMKRFDLIFSVNVRATFMCSKFCIPHLKKSTNPHVLTLSPPLHLASKWFEKNLAYTMSKYGMSMCTLGMAAEFADDGIAFNSLWPRTLIATAAVEFNFPKKLYQATRKPSIMADAAYKILTSNSRKVTGQFFIDEDYLRTQGVDDFSIYASNPHVTPYQDLYIE